jgi:uncharacterized protein (DUF1778 family)
MSTIRNKEVQTSVRIPRDLYQRIKAAADANRDPVNTFMVRLLDYGIKEWEYRQRLLDADDRRRHEPPAQPDQPPAETEKGDAEEKSG